MTIPRPRRPNITAREKQAILAAFIAGDSYKVIARRLKCSTAPIARICQEYKKLSETAAEQSLRDELIEWKANLKRESISAILRGLRDDSDNYKAAQLACVVMKGIGEFKDATEGGSGVSITLNVPAAWQERYNKASIDTQAVEVKQLEEPKKSE